MDSIRTGCHAVINGCKDYLNGFPDLWHWKENSAKKTALAAVKVFFSPIAAPPLIIAGGAALLFNCATNPNMFIPSVMSDKEWRNMVGTVIARRGCRRPNETQQRATELAKKIEQAMRTEESQDDFGLLQARESLREYAQLNACGLQLFDQFRTTAEGFVFPEEKASEDKTPKADRYVHNLKGRLLSGADLLRREIQSMQEGDKESAGTLRHEVFDFLNTLPDVTDHLEWQKWDEKNNPPPRERYSYLATTPTVSIEVYPFPAFPDR